MKDYSEQNKKAWEYSAYDFWTKTAGTPAERAKQDMADPEKMLRRYAKYFDSYRGVKVANICGSCGKKAIPLALLGAEVTVFDISEENRRYASETARAAGVPLDYVVTDVMEINLGKYGGYFDVVFMEGGILHYFHDLDAFMVVMYSLLKPGGKMICSDFHPFTKIRDALGLETPAMSYFSTEVFEGEMAHARFYDAETRKCFPKCSYRKYTISEIINSIINSGFRIVRFDEHPSWKDKALPGEFTAVAIKAKPHGCGD
jgi:2-polyprenyl-3-methyl-5-hydroxy-6-metoxy-1,4-benzoquinol methylase